MGKKIYLRFYSGLYLDQMQMWIEYFIKIKYKNIKEMPKIYYILVPNIFTYFETYQYFGHFLNLKIYIYVCVYKQLYIYIYVCK